MLVKFADGGPKKKKNHQLNISTQWTARRDEVSPTLIHRGSTVTRAVDIMHNHDTETNIDMLPYQPLKRGLNCELENHILATEQRERSDYLLLSMFY